MKNRIMLGASLAVALACSAIAAEGDPKSGPPVGSRSISAFHPMHATGPQEGTRSCLV